MKNLNFIIPILISVVISGCDTKPETKYKTLTGATIFDGNGNTIKNGVIVIREDKIEDIGDSTTEIPSGSEIIDVTGKFITPGFVDAHVHYVQSGFFDSNASHLNLSLADTFPNLEVEAYQRENPERYHEANLRSGVTAVYEPGGRTWSFNMQRTRSPNTPHFATTGALINPYVTWETMEPLFIIPESEEHIRSIVTELHLMGAVGIKIWQLNLSDENYMRNVQAAADEVVKRGNKLVVHAMDLDQAKEALRLGAKVLVHSVGDTLVDDEFIELAIRNKVIYCPTLIVVNGYTKAWESVLGISEFPFDDPNNVVDNKTKSLVNNANLFLKFMDSTRLANDVGKEKILNERRTNIQIQNLKKVYEAGITIATSTDAGNPGTLHGLSYIDELEAMQDAGIPARDLIAMSTRNGAMVMERVNDIGTLESGKIADLVILERDPSQDISNVRTMTHVMHYGLLRSVRDKFETSTANNR